MGFKTTTLAFTVTGLTGAQKAVLVALAHCMNDKSGRCNPGHTTLGRMTALSEKTVRRSLASLEEQGHISRTEVVVGNERRGTNYTLNLAPPRPPVKVTPGQSDQGSQRPGGAVKVTGGVVTESTPPGHSDHLTGREQEGTGGEAPPRFCSKHPNGSDGVPCGACRDARIAHEEWATTKKARPTQIPPRAVTTPDTCTKHKYLAGACVHCGDLERKEVA